MESKVLRNKKMPYSIGEEIANAVLHGVGAMLALIGYGYMLALCIHYGNALAIAACSLYCFTLCMMFLSSACYHALPYPRAKKILRILDHCAIFLLIAGTNAPYVMLVLHGVGRWVFFGVLWICALLGVVLNAIDMKKFAKVSMCLYILMGWAVVITIKSMIAAVSMDGMLFLLAGGLFYTVGILFYVRKGVSYMHSVWHIFVLLGALVHFYGILLYVLPVSFGLIA